MKKFSSFVVKNKYIFLGLFFALIIASAVLMNFVNINYDLTKYLPEDSQTRQSLQVMQKEFGADGTATIMLKNVSETKSNEIATLIQNIDGVSTCVKAQYKVEGDIGYALLEVFLESSDYTQETETSINNIKTTLDNQLSTADQNYYLTGSAVTATSSRLAIQSEIPTILIIAVAIVLLVLAITTKSWIEPVILLLVIGTAILINMGTNYFLGEISFISNTISSVLLIALAMDYSIVLVNRFREEKEKNPNDIHEAMKKALAGTFTTILASGCTVMAGLISLCFMEYKIGFDLGMVLTKGVFISILAVMFLMPAILLLFSNIIEKTTHRSFLPGLKKIGTFAKVTRFVLPAIFVVIVTLATICQFTTLDFNYVAKFANDGNETVASQQKVQEVFGEQNALVVILPKQTSIEDQKSIFSNIVTLNNNDVINNASSFATMSANNMSLGLLVNSQALAGAFGITVEDANAVIASSNNRQNGTAYVYEIIENLGTNTTLQQVIGVKYPTLTSVIPTIYAQEQTAKELFYSDNYVRFIFNINASTDNEKAINYIKDLNKYFDDNNYDFYIVCNTQNVVETDDVFAKDRIAVELISMLAILLIVTITFRSGLISLILVVGIEGAIMVNLACNALAGNTIFFICYLIGTAIQMGATIDYGILLADRYKFARKKQGKFEAIKTAIDKSFSTIISSGSILTLAAFTIGVVSSVPLISSIGYLIGFGALCATITILFIIPQFLLLFDKAIAKTTYKAGFIDESQVVEVQGEVKNSVVEPNQDNKTE